MARKRRGSRADLMQRDGWAFPGKRGKRNKRARNVARHESVDRTPQHRLSVELPFRCYSDGCTVAIAADSVFCPACWRLVGRGPQMRILLGWRPEVPDHYGTAGQSDEWRDAVAVAARGIRIRGDIDHASEPLRGPLHGHGH